MALQTPLPTAVSLRYILYFLTFLYFLCRSPTRLFSFVDFQVDFQLCVWTSPAVDILYFMNTSPSDDVIVHHWGALLQEYLDTLTKTMTRLGCKTKAPSMAALEKSLKEREFYGVISACTILPLMLVDKSEAKSLDEIMGEDGEYENPGYKGPLYRKTMLRRLPDWNARGLLDV